MRFLLQLAKLVLKWLARYVSEVERCGSGSVEDDKRIACRFDWQSTSALTILSQVVPTHSTINHVSNSTTLLIAINASN